MLVGVDERWATCCAGALSPMLVIRVAHVQAAVERMLVTRPLVIVVRPGFAPGDLASLKEAAHDIVAEVLELGEFMGEGAVAALLKEAVGRAEEARKSRGG
jgi:hypothetical protein